jgi:large subunit ribosomal protein L17
MLANMATSLIKHKRIFTTLAKAKALRRFVEPILTRAKSDTTHSRRMAFADLKNKEAVTILYREVASKIAGRPGGYTRIIKIGNRKGDSAEMAMIELVDFNELLLGNTKSASNAKTKATRRSRKKAKSNVEPTNSVETQSEETKSDNQQTE